MRLVDLLLLLAKRFSLNEGADHPLNRRIS